jgi:hypothetical protein
MKKTPGGEDRGSSPEGLGIRTIRHTTKEHYVDNVLMPYLTDKTKLVDSPQYQRMIEAGKSHDEALIAASHERLLEITRQLDSADKGGIGEKWYAEWFAKTGDKTQFTVSKADIEKRYPGVDLKQDRNIDLFQKVDAKSADIVEIKNVSGSLKEARLESEMDAHLALRAKDIKDGADVVTVRNVVWVLLDPTTLKEPGTATFIFHYLKMGAEFRIQTPEGTHTVTSVNYRQLATEFGGAK